MTLFQARPNSLRLSAVVASQPLRTDPLHAGPFTDQLSFQNHFLSDAMHGEVTGDINSIFPGRLNGFAFESNFREFRGIEKIWRSEVLVAHLDAGVDAGCFDAHLNG